MIKKTAEEVSAMQADYQNMDFSVRQLKPNIEEAYFDRQGVIEFLNTLQTQYVKVALAWAPKNQLIRDDHITLVMLGVSGEGIVQHHSEGLVSDIPCPPTCREKTLKSKIIISV